MRAYVGNQPVGHYRWRSAHRLDLATLAVRSLANVKSVVTSASDLIKALLSQRPETAPTRTPAVHTSKVGKVESFFRDFSNTISEEDIQREPGSERTSQG
jgi:hypothetical protein